jgi:TPR repeat protein
MDEQRNVLLAKLKSLPPPPFSGSCDPMSVAKVSSDEAITLARSALQANDYATLNCWCRIAGLLGNRDGAAYYASSLAKGRAITQDYDQSRLWNKLAAEFGSKVAEENLARASYNGWGEPKDMVKAYYYRLLAEQDKERPGDVNTSHYCDVDNPIGATAIDALAAWMVTFNSGNIRTLWCWQVIGTETGQPTLQEVSGSQFILAD